VWHKASGSPRHAHRVLFRVLDIPLPPGMVCDHLCHNRACQNPTHIRHTTQQENTKNRGVYLHRGKLVNQSKATLK
jgi:hypothetical protein